MTVADDKVDSPAGSVTTSSRPPAPPKDGEAEALEVLAHLLGGGQTSVLYRALVVKEKLAVSAWAYYHGAALDQSRSII